MALPWRVSQLAMAAIVLGGLVFIGAAVLIAQTSLETAAGYEVERLESEVSTLTRNNQMLEADVASLKSLDRIEQQAMGQLKMIKPNSYTYITVDMLPPGYTAPQPSQEVAEAPSESWLGSLISGLFGQRRNP
jgi:cell division protein FtsB